MDNVWIGTSVENQEQADKRIPHLLRIPAKVRFLSMEPLLGPVDLGKCYENEVTQFNGGINWVIVGGESGQNARPMHPAWARSLRDQCRKAGVPYFFKQFGEWADTRAAQIVSDGPVTDGNGNVLDWMHRSVTFADGTSRKVRSHSWTDHATDLMYFVGKKAAGRLLDSVEYSQFPT
jgi:protein gp37